VGDHVGICSVVLLFLFLLLTTAGIHASPGDTGSGSRAAARKIYIHSAALKVLTLPMISSALLGALKGSALVGGRRSCTPDAVLCAVL
jgi:hypothetical protein